MKIFWSKLQEARSNLNVNHLVPGTDCKVEHSIEAMFIISMTFVNIFLLAFIVIVGLFHRHNMR